MANYISKIAIENSNNEYVIKTPYLYGVCSTAAGTAAKVVTLQGNNSGYVLTVGDQVLVKFTNYNTAASPTLNVNGTGAKPMQYSTATEVSTYDWPAGGVELFVYDGTRWMRAQGVHATTTYWGMTKLEDSITSESNKLAATANAARLASLNAGSADTSNKIYLTGATTQTTSATTYSDNEVYAQDGALAANNMKIKEKINLVYDDTNDCLNFVFL